MAVFLKHVLNTYVKIKSMQLKKYIPTQIFLKNRDVFGVYNFLISRNLVKSPRSALRLSNFILIIMLVASIYTAFKLHSISPIQVDSYYDPITDFDKYIY